MIRLVRRLTFIVLLLSILSLACGCGYHLAGKSLNAGQGRTLAIPTFVNRTTNYRIEQTLSEAVRREFIRRTRYRVVAENSGDVVLTGEVLAVVAVPVIFNPAGHATTYAILVDVNVKLVDSKTKAVIFQAPRWTFRDVFQLAPNSSEFVPEDTPALDRLAGRFASTLVASVLAAKP